MVQQVVTRTQRRVERKQLVLVVLLILAVAGVSFFLGILAGRQQGRMEALLAEGEVDSLPTVAQVKPPPMPETEAVGGEQEKLTFYDNLPKGKQAPLGSGINLPPEQNKAVTDPPREKQVQAVKPPPSTPKAVAPPASQTGDFVVQVASFKSGDEAKKLATRLTSYHLATFVETADLGEKGVWHRVLAGPFATRENADQAIRLLREKERLSALVRQR